MEKSVPTELVKDQFKAQIRKLAPSYNRNNVDFYDAQTSFGRMTLIVEHYIGESKIGDSKVSLEQAQQFIEVRNKLCRSNKICCPLIYQQKIKKVGQDEFYCLTLTKPIKVKKSEQALSYYSFDFFEELVECGYRVNETELVYDAQTYLLQQIVCSQYNDKVYFDFTRLIRSNAVKDQNGEDVPFFQKYNCENFLNFRDKLCRFMALVKAEKLPYLIFIKEKSMLFNPKAIAGAESWFDLATMFNLLHGQKVNLIKEDKVKQTKIGRLKENPVFDFKGKRYSSYNFEDGYRIDAFIELNYQHLRDHFFEPGLTYLMSKKRYQLVTKKNIRPQIWVKNTEDNFDLIIVEKQITKAEFISFLIGYFKYIEPVIRVIQFVVDMNALRIEYINRESKHRIIKIKFSQSYVVKDEEICMIIEKARLKNATLNLEKTAITDSCLMFLANCDKMLNITTLDLSYCPNITDTGVHSLYASPLCRNINILKASGLPLVDISVVKFRKQLKELYINQGRLYDQQLDIHDWKLQRLEAIGVNVNLNLPSSLWVLRLSVEVSLEGLKALKHLSLIELKICLMDDRNSVKTILTNLKMKDSSVKVFAEGRSKNTLKSLDISGSNVKLKELRPMFAIETLQTLICQDMERQYFLDMCLPAHVVNLSFSNSKINGQILNQILAKTSILIRLNVYKTDISQKSMVSFIESKRLLSLLEIDEEQLNTKMLLEKSGVQSINVHFQKLIRNEYEMMLNKTLMTEAENNKEINIICGKIGQEKLVEKIQRFTVFYEKHLKEIKIKNLNISINNELLWKLIDRKQFKYTEQSIVAIDKNNLDHRVNVYPRALVSQNLLRATGLHIEAFNVFLHKTMRLCPDHLLEINIKSNRVLSRRVIKLIRQYAGNLLKAIDFRDCLFTFGDVKQELYEFPYLDYVNQGQYEIILSEQDNCEAELQKILKFFMRLRHTTLIKLFLRGQEIHERELYYSILFQILHHHKQIISDLTIEFKNMKADSSEMFWRQVFGLSKLTSFKITYSNDILTEGDTTLLAEEFKNIGNLKLIALDINSNMPQIFPHNLKFPELQKLILDFGGQSIRQVMLAKLLKDLTSLTHLDLRLGNNEFLTSLKRISDMIEKMHELVYLTFHAENCALKEHSIYDFITNLGKNPNLERFEMNINNVQTNIPELIKFCQVLQKANHKCYIQIYALQLKKQVLFRDQDELLEKGIQIIYNR